MKSSLRLSRRFEYMVVILLTGLVALVAVDRYQFMGRETQKLGFELLSHNFIAAAANAHVQWLVERQQPGTVSRGWIILDEQHRLYVNNQGWPRGAQPITQPLRVEDCEFLWQQLLQNPPPASLEGSAVRISLRGDERYHISLRFGEVCRYEFLLGERSLYSFDYATRTGQLVLNLPSETGTR